MKIMSGYLKTIQDDSLPSDDDMSLMSENCDFGSLYFSPTKETWALGDRNFLCIREK